MFLNLNVLEHIFWNVKLKIIAFVILDIKQKKNRVTENYE